VILSVDSSGKAASVALIQDGIPVASASQDIGLTHSRTLLPMIDSMLRNSEVSAGDISAYAVTSGPGSFTGLRIGISTVKGMAFTKDQPCVAVSTLEAAAASVFPLNGTIAVLFNAHFAGKAYFALFDRQTGALQRRCSDSVQSPEQIVSKLADLQGPAVVLGDTEDFPQIKSLLQENRRFLLLPRRYNMHLAVGAGMIAHCRLKQGLGVSADQIIPTYLTLPQAERDRLKKLEKNN
jgi:tRNA threonylcarbamoyladenosine biosynthesis protein TsaB